MTREENLSHRAAMDREHPHDCNQEPTCPSGTLSTAPAVRKVVA
jgi:hypothetical protein